MKRNIEKNEITKNKKLLANMTLDEAIQHCDEVSKSCNNEQCSLDHLQLKEWLIELKKFKEHRYEK